MTEDGSGYRFMTVPLKELPADAPAQFLTDDGTSFAQNLLAILELAFWAVVKQRIAQTDEQMILLRMIPRSRFLRLL
jgi:hypothetical protein